MENKVDLADLLKKNSHKPFLKQLLQDCPDGLIFTASGPVALREVKDIFRFRARRNESMGEPIKGFKELIEGLDAFSSDAVVIYSIDSDSGPYKVFADARRTEFAGVLKFPKEPFAKTSSALSELQTA